MRTCSDLAATGAYVYKLLTDSKIICLTINALFPGESSFLQMTSSTSRLKNAITSLVLAKGQKYYT